ncbi:MAG: hypothetical protein WBO09_09985 [Methylocystis silviterrae]|jgi:hypothetical protein|uniref:hypothetical protein n=1 Tax=Methylocystis TaxID=133 RepID=UPI0018C29952|nr:hypothetical protein [Methylocystis sp. H4A]MBG0801243.1 hypothetical protein [Methylocystis sp. H4A]
MSTDAGRSLLRGRNIIIAAALIALFGAFGVRMWRFVAPPALPTLLEGLPESKTEADQRLFQARLAKRFHLGSTEVEDLIVELRDDGFTVDADNDVATYERRADISDKCRRSANIHWSRGEGDELATITGGYSLHCPQH